MMLFYIARPFVKADGIAPYSGIFVAKEQTRARSTKAPADTRTPKEVMAAEFAKAKERRR